MKLEKNKGRKLSYIKYYRKFVPVVMRVGCYGEISSGKKKQKLPLLIRQCHVYKDQVSRKKICKNSGVRDGWDEKRDREESIAKRKIFRNRKGRRKRLVEEQ